MIEEFKTFIAVVELRNFTKAGIHLNLSQPTVSTHIKNLEYNFGVKLIDRSIKQKNIFITEKGNLLYRRSKEILNLIDITYKDLSNDSDSIKGTIKVGASYTIGEYILPKFLSIFSEKYPDIDVEISINNSSIVCSNLKNSILDIGLIEGAINDSSFHKEYFFKDKMVLALPLDFPLLKDDFGFDKLQNQKWIEREMGSGTREYLDLFLSKNKIKPKSIMIFGSNYSIKEAVKNNLGITLLSELVALPAATNNELSLIELGNEFTRNFSYILQKNITLSEVTQLFLDELKQYCLELKTLLEKQSLR